MMQRYNDAYKINVEYMSHKIFNPLYSGKPQMSTFANSEGPDGSSIMLHFIRDYTVCKGKKKSLDKRLECNKKKFHLNLTSLEMYNGLSQLDCIKPEGRIH